MITIQQPKHYVYIHLIPNLEVFYVGKGVGGRSHSKKSRNQYWHYMSRNGYTIIITDYYHTNDEAAHAEIELIAEYKQLGCNLVNQTIGGDGGSTGRTWSDETRQKISERVSGELNGMYGKKWTDKQKKWKSESLKGDKNSFFGKTHTQETRDKMKAAWEKRKQKPLSEQTRAKLKISNSGENNGMYGRKHSIQTKLKMREAALNRKNKAKSN